MTKRKDRIAKTIGSTGLFQKLPAEREGEGKTSTVTGEENRSNREADTIYRMPAVVTRMGGKITPYGELVS